MNLCRLRTLFFGLSVASCLIYLLAIGVIFPALMHHGYHSSLGLSSIRFQMNTSAKESVLRQPANDTRTSINGTVRHYKSVLGNQPFTLNCSSCALVSNSGILLGRKAGKEIDNHSCVLRMNMAPVRGYEADVGSRTDLQVMNFFMLNVEPEKLPPGSKIVVWGLFKRTAYLENATRLAERLSEGSTIYGQSLEGEREAEDVFAKETGLNPRKTRSWISTGWFAMMITLDLCQQISVYGMVPSSYCMRRPKKDVAYHYYEQSWIKECSTYKSAEGKEDGGHRFITEKAVFARWAQRYNVTFHCPDWDLRREKLSGKLDTPFVKKQSKTGGFFHRFWS